VNYELGMKWNEADARCFKALSMKFAWRDRGKPREKPQDYRGLRLDSNTAHPEYKLKALPPEH
jgi:hypothetical protein